MAEKVKVFVVTRRKEGAEGELYDGLWVHSFHSKGKPDSCLTPLEKHRFEAWLHLRAAVRGKTATGKDRSAALEKMAAILRDVLPATLVLGPPKKIIDKVVNEQTGELVKRVNPPYAVWETPFRLGDGPPQANFCKELNRTKTPDGAYEYWSFVVLRQTMLTEWKGVTAILCFDNTGSKDGIRVSSLEVAHYASALLDNRPAFCLRCGNIFVPARSDAEYCGDTCRWADQKAKQRKKQRAGKRRSRNNRRHRIAPAEDDEQRFQTT